MRTACALMVTPPRPTLIRIDDLRQARQRLLKSMSCCGILGKKSKRSSVERCDTFGVSMPTPKDSEVQADRVLSCSILAGSRSSQCHAAQAAELDTSKLWQLLRPNAATVLVKCHVAPAGCHSSAAACSSLFPGVHLIAPEELASLLGQVAPLSSHAAVAVLDCRSFMSFNNGHIRGAINVSCTSKCTQKRMRHGSVGDFISASDAKELFHSSPHIVAYDETTEDLATMTDALTILLTALLKENKNVHVLKGGMKSFRERCHSFCATSALLPMTSSSDERKETVQLTLPRGSPLAPSQRETTDDAYTGDTNGTSVEDCPPSVILSFLYIGNEKDASSLESLKRLGITHVLNATTHAPCTYEQCDVPLKYKRLPVKDTMHQNMQPYFAEAVEFIDDARASGGRVLVHCHAGVSRSATLAIAYLLRRSLLSTLDAYDFVKRRRHVISPNINFMGQLLEYERSICSSPKGRDNSLQLEVVSENRAADA